MITWPIKYGMTLSIAVAKREDRTSLTCSGCTAVTASWCAGSGALKTETKHPLLPYSRNLLSLNYNSPSPSAAQMVLSTAYQVLYQFCHRLLSVFEECGQWMWPAWRWSGRKTRGDPMLKVAWCCQLHRVGPDGTLDRFGLIDSKWLHRWRFRIDKFFNLTLGIFTYPRCDLINSVILIGVPGILRLLRDWFKMSRALNIAWISIPKLCAS